MISSGKAQKEQTSEAIKTQIDENLRHVYEETLRQDLPDRFRNLLDQLRRKEGSQE